VGDGADEDGIIVGDGADEDGIIIDQFIQGDDTLDVPSFLTVTASAAGKLDVWIDYNDSDEFDTSEHLNSGVSFDLVAGSNTLDFDVPAGAETVDNVWLRARFSSAGSLAPTGRADDGEVEDYVLNITELYDAQAVDPVLPMWPQTSDSTPLVEWVPAAGTPAGANGHYLVEVFDDQAVLVQSYDNHIETSVELEQLAAGTYTIDVTSFNRAGVTRPEAKTTLPPFDVVAMEVLAPIGDIDNGTPVISYSNVNQTQTYQIRVVSTVTNAVVYSVDVPGTSSSHLIANANELPIGNYDVTVRAIEDVTGQPGDWSAPQNFNVVTAPSISAPQGMIATHLPQVGFGPVPGAATYDIQIANLTDDIDPVINVTGHTSLTYDVTTQLPIGDYEVRVRGKSADQFEGDWATSQFRVAVPSVVSNPLGTITINKPTALFSAVNGADHYDLEIVTALGQPVLTANDLTDLEYAIPQPLEVGDYEIRVTAVNEAAATSSTGDVEVTSVAAFTVAPIGELTSPHTGIYNTRPTFDWVSPFGADSAELVLTDSNDLIVFSQAGIVGSSFTIPLGSELEPGVYNARVRFTGNGVTTGSSPVRVFTLGAPPALLGPSEGLGIAPQTQTDSPRPTLQSVQAPFQVTMTFWLASITEGFTKYVVSDQQSSSFTPPSNLPVGEYVWYAKASTVHGEDSQWSKPYYFGVTTPPIAEPQGPSFNSRPTLIWNASRPQSEIDSYETYLIRTDVSPTVVVEHRQGLTGNSYVPSTDLPNGNYAFYVRGANVGVNGETTLTSFSERMDFEVGGRPHIDPIEDSTDSTPTITFSEVEGATRYYLWLAAAGSSSPLVYLTDLTSPFYPVQDPLDSGAYNVWVRAESTTGQLSPWSLAESFEISAAGVPTLNPVDVSTNRPVFSWSLVANVVGYEIHAGRRNQPVPAEVNADVPGTSYQSPVALASGDYRAWVRAIHGDGSRSIWSNFVDFTIAELDQTDNEQGTILTSFDLPGSLLQNDSVSVTLIPAAVVEQNGEEVAAPQQNVSLETPVARVIPETVVEQIDEVTADEVMSDFNHLIQEAESTTLAEPVADSRALEPVDNREDGRGWLAGMALLAPSIFRRRRNRKSDSDEQEQL
ncbi:MAG TPA: hypothetical protein DCG12_00520, partial [Planctomycetaceae bacterium]|nr:hypothetical protein [Planctomycetaceae bacterium]